jgi:hypothetical protein
MGYPKNLTYDFGRHHGVVKSFSNSPAIRFGSARGGNEYSLLLLFQFFILQLLFVLSTTTELITYWLFINSLPVKDFSPDFGVINFVQLLLIKPVFQEFF